MKRLILLYMLVISISVFAQSDYTPRPFTLEIYDSLGLTGGIPNATLITNEEGESQIILIYSGGNGTLHVATSQDGIEFETQPFNDMIALFEPLGLLPRDVIVRQLADSSLRYFLKGLPAPEVHERHVFAVNQDIMGNLELANNGEPVYTGSPDDNGVVEVIDIIPTQNNAWRMFYVALATTPGNIRTAVSYDEGLSWEAEHDNPFNDINLENRAHNINVDPAPLQLQDGTYIAATMRAGTIYFWDSPDGYHFYQVDDIYLSPEMIIPDSNVEVQALFDPTLVQTPDGKILMYVTAGTAAHGEIVAVEISLPSSSANNHNETVDWTVSDFEPPTGWEFPPEQRGNDDYGPWNRRMLIAFSEDDGITWTRTGHIISDQADYPSAIFTDDERVIIYFITYHPEYRNQIVAAVSENYGVNWVYKLVTFDFTDPPPPVDPSAILLEDGRIRLFFNHRLDQPNIAIFSAISDDGLHFSLDTDIAHYALPDQPVLAPSIIQFSNGYHLYALNQSGGLHHAFSTDGHTFELADNFELNNLHFIGQGFLQIDEGVRVFTFNGSPAREDFQPVIHSYRSLDGFNWEQETGERLSFDSEISYEAVTIRNPAVTRLSDNRILMVYLTVVPGADVE